MSSNEMLTSRVVIKNIPQYYDEEKLKLFIQNNIGTSITDIRIPKDVNGNSRKFAFVGLRDVQQAQKTIQILDKTFLDTCRLNISPAFPPGSSSIPRPWSRHAKGSSAYDRSQQIKQQRIQKKETKQNAKNISRVTLSNNATIIANETINSKDNAYQTLEKQEFIKLNSGRRHRNTWIDDISGPPKKKFKHISVESVIPTKAGVQATRTHVEFHDSDEEENESTDASETLNQIDEPIDKSNKSKNNEEIHLEEETEDDPLTWLKNRSTNLSKVGDENIVEGSDQNKEKVVNTTNKHDSKEDNEVSMSTALETLETTGRLLILNIPYSMNEDELRLNFAQYGELKEVHICKDENRNQSRGRAFVSFLFPDHAVRALPKINQSIVQGRIIRAIPAESRKEPLVGIEKVVGSGKKASSSYKRQLEEKLKTNAGNMKTWNLLYMSANAATDAIAQQMGIEKRDFLGLSLEENEDPSESAAARVALGETQIIQETKRWLKKEGIDMSVFERQGVGLLQNSPLNEQKERLTDCIIIKHLPAGTKSQEIFELFSRSGPLARYCLAPSGTVAVVQFMESEHARKAFKQLAYTKFKNFPLFLEWAPSNIYIQPKPSNALSSISSTEQESSLLTEQENETEQLKDLLKKEEEDLDRAHHASLFMKNLNFKTTEDTISKLFSDCNGYIKVTIRKKKRTTKTENGDTVELNLSSGYGFIEFNSLKAATDAMQRFQGIVIDDHSIQLQVSERTSATTNLTENETSITMASSLASSINLSLFTNKLTVRNLSFQASKKDLRKLFSAYGTVTAIRIPKNVEGRSKGYGFIEMITRTEALTALEALQHTHLYGRKMIIEPAQATDTSVEAVRSKQKLVQPTIVKPAKFSESLTE